MQKQSSQVPALGVEGLAPGPQVPSRHSLWKHCLEDHMKIRGKKDSKFTACRTTVSYRTMFPLPAELSGV